MLNDSNADYEGKGARKPLIDRSDNERTHAFVDEIQTIIDNHSSKSNMFIDRDMAVSEFLIR